MFTGIIEAVEKVKAVSKDRLETAVPADWTLAVRRPEAFDTAPAQALAVGESVAVNGVCLTVISYAKSLAAFDMSPETFKKTALGSLKKDALVNLERAMKADGRFSGHFVTGHVDGEARLLDVRKAAGSFVLTFEAPSSGALLVEKGSVALNGVSLTIFDLTGDTFKTAVIPHTWESTNLKHLKAGAALNIEYDILGKYALKNTAGKITRAYLAENGF